MNKADIERWIAENGGAGAVQYSSKRVEIPNPARKDISSPNYDASAPEKITVLEESWVNAKTGAFLSTRQDPDTGPDAYVETARKDVKPTETPKTPAAPPVEKDQDGRHWVWQANPDGVGGVWKDVGPAAQKPATPPQERVNPSDPTRRQKWDATANDGKGDWVDSGAVTKESPNGFPTTRINPTTGHVEHWDPTLNGGKGGAVDDGEPHKDPKNPQLITAGGKVFRLADDGQSLIDITPAPTTVPSGLQGWRPDTTKPDLGLFDRKQGWAQAVEQGIATPQQAEEGLRQDYALAQNVAENVRNIQTTGTAQRGQDVSLINTRAQAATTNFGNSAKIASALNADLPQGSDLGGQGLFALLQLANNQMRQYGALENPQAVTPGTNYPGLPRPEELGIGAAAPPPAAAAAPPAPAPEQAPAPDPNAPPPIDTSTPDINAGGTNPMLMQMLGGGAQPPATGAAANLDPSQMAMGAMPPSIANLMQGRMPDPVSAELARLGFGQDAIQAGKDHYSSLLQQRLGGMLFGQGV